MSNPGPIYEVTLTADPEIVDSFDTWLAEHIHEVLQLPGFARCEVFETQADEQGRAQRVCQYFLDSEAELAQYLSGPASDMRESAARLFGDRFSASRRILRPADFADGGMRPIESCLNCGTTLGGQYCANCGQRADSRLISILDMTRDAFGDLFELDSRLWRTLLPLLTRPGRLTRDYLEGRRARYMPPFRTYLVLSLLFFFTSFFEPEKDFGILFEPGSGQQQDAGSDTATPGADAIQQEIAGELADSGIVVGTADDDSSPEDESSAPRLSIGTDGADCNVDDMDLTEMPLWLQKRFTPERLQHVCESLNADNGGAFLDKLKDYVPAALIILLPLMAFVLKVLYPLSKRYYVEHLLFIVHYHAFVFLILTLQITFSRISAFAGLSDTAVNVTIVAASIYIPVYLYKAMRRVYGQGHTVTVGKYLVLALAYLLGVTTIFVFAAVLAAFAIAA